MTEVSGSTKPQTDPVKHRTEDQTDLNNTTTEKDSKMTISVQDDTTRKKDLKLRKPYDVCLNERGGNYSQSSETAN